MSSYVLKLFAIFFMFLDHFGYSILGKVSVFNFLGRLAFPIFAFQCVQGVIHTRNPKKHMVKLLLFGIVSQIPFILFLSTFTKVRYLNIFFTLFLGSFSIYLFKNINNKFIGFILVALLSTIGEILPVDYGAYGVLLIFIFFICDNNIILKILGPFGAILIHNIINIFKNINLLYIYTISMVFTMFSLVFILLYNGKEGKKSKYFFYIFYPLHLSLLYLAHMLLY